VSSLASDGQTVPWSTTEDSGQDLVEDCGQAGGQSSTLLQFAASMLPVDTDRPPHTPSTVHLMAGQGGLDHHSVVSGCSQFFNAADHNPSHAMQEWSNRDDGDQTDYAWLTSNIFPQGPVVQQDHSRQTLNNWPESKQSSSAPHGNIHLMTPDMFMPPHSSLASQWEQGSALLPSSEVSDSHERVVSYLSTHDSDYSATAQMQTSPRKSRIAARFNVPLTMSPMSPSHPSDHNHAPVTSSHAPAPTISD